MVIDESFLHDNGSTHSVTFVSLVTYFFHTPPYNLHFLFFNTQNYI